MPVSEKLFKCENFYSFIFHASILIQATGKENTSCTDNAGQKSALPTPMRKAIQKGKRLNHVARRSTRISNRQQSMAIAKQTDEKPVAQALFDADAEEPVRRALPTPMRRAIAKRGHKEVQPSPEIEAVADMASNKRALPTPMRKAIAKGKNLNHVSRRSARISNRQQSVAIVEEAVEEPVAQTLFEADAEVIAEEPVRRALPMPMRQDTRQGKQLKPVTRSCAQVEEAVVEESVKNTVVPPRRSSRLQNKRRIQELPKSSAPAQTHEVVVDMIRSTINKVSFDTISSAAPTTATKRKIQQISSVQCKRTRSSRQQCVTASSTSSSSSSNSKETLEPRRSHRLRTKRRLSSDSAMTGPRRSRRLRSQNVRIYGMTTLQLRNALRQLNLKVSGLKAELQQRLHDAMSDLIV